MRKVLPQDLIDYLASYHVSPEDLIELTDEEISQMIEEFNNRDNDDDHILDGVLDWVCSHFCYGKGAEMYP